MKASRWRGIDPLGPAASVAALLVFLLQGYGAALGRDAGLYAYSGIRVADGVAPYVSVLTRAGPFGHLVNGLGALVARLLHTDPVLTMRGLMTGLLMVAVWVLYAVGRDLLGSRPAGVAAVAAVLVFQDLVDFATDGPREKTTMVLLVVLGLWAVLHRRWAVAGVTVALATLTWQPAFLFGAPVAVAALLTLPRRDLVRGVARFAGAGLLTAAALAVVFWAWGALDDFAQCFLVINARYTQESDLVSLAQNHPEFLYDGHAADLVVMVVGLVATLVPAAPLVRRIRGLDAADATRVGLAAGVVGSVLWALLLAYQGWPDTMVLAPAAALGVSGLLVRLARRATLPVVAGFCVLALTTAGLTAQGGRTDELTTQRDQVTALLAAGPRGSTVASVNAPQALVLAGKVNPSPYQMFVGGFRGYYRDTFPGGLAGLRDHIASERPTFIAVRLTGYHAFIERLLTREYTRVGLVLDVEWWARTDLGDATLQRLRHALGEAG